MNISTEFKLIVCGFLLIFHTVWARYWRIKLSKSKKISYSLIAFIGSLSLLGFGLYGFFSVKPIYALYAFIGMYIFRYLVIPRH